MTFTGLTEDMCRRAFGIMCSGQHAAVTLGIANKYAGTLVVVDPFAVPSSNDPAQVSLDEAVTATLFMCRVDQDYPDGAKYDEIALAKARDMWVLRPFGITSSRDIQQNFPHLYRPGMTKWHGGTCRSGIPIGFSGIQGNFDEANAVAVEAWLTAMCREEMTKPDGVMANESSFIESSGRLSPEGVRQMGRAGLNAME